MTELRDFIDDMWADRLGRLKAPAERRTPSGGDDAPEPDVERQLRIEAPAETV